MTPKKLMVLILEDSAADAELIENALRAANLDFTAVQVDREQEFYRVLLELAPDLIFADHALVATHERSALSASRHLHPAVPFIFISDTPGEEAAVEAVKRGATDYVLKKRITRLGTVAHRALREKPWTAALVGMRAAEHNLAGERTDRVFQELGHLLRAIREIKRLIARNREPETLLGDAAMLLLRIRDYLHVGFGLVVSRHWRVPPVTRSARKMDYLDRFSVNWSGLAADPVPARDVIHSGQSWVCRATAKDPRFELWRDGALACGCGAVAAIPLIHDGQVIGAMTVCAERPGSFHPEEIRLLEELAGDLAFALMGMRRDQAFRDVVARLHLLGSALKSAANAMAITDRDGCVLWINRAFTGLTGYSLDEMCGQQTNILKSGTQDEAFHRNMWETILAGNVWHSQMINRRKDGTLYTEECTITPVRNDEGEVVHFIAVKQDVTERQRADEALRWRTTFFEALMDSSLDGILVVDSAGKKILQNRRMVAQWKIPPYIANDLNDTEQVRFVTARTKNPAEFAKKVARLYANPDAVSRDEIELVDGMILDRYSSPVRDDTGKYYGRIWTFRDITERRQLEAQFRQAQKMEAVGQLAGGVAHDFNNILTAVIMHLGILQTTLTDPETMVALQELESQAQRAADLTRQLLMFSRKSAIELQPIGINHVVEDMLKMLRRLLGEHVHVEFHGTSGLPLVEADRGMMQQVVMNLSVNGRDAMPDGGRLTIATALAEFAHTQSERPERRPGRFILLSVTDTGCGMDEATRKRIFEPFFTTKALGKGTGLGLATVYGIVQQHRGWVEVASAPGCGSTFNVYLPATEKPGTLQATETTLIMRRGQQETILLVEDEAMVRLVTARGLQMLGYRVIEATNGQMALDLWTQHSGTIRLLLTDMIMPHGLSGMELAERLQREQPALKVIIASGYSAEISARGIPTKPGILYLPKPFEMLSLASAIRTCLDQK